MLTPDQLRLRLEAAGRAYANDDTDTAEMYVISVLHEMFPELVAPAQKQADPGSQRYSGGVPGRMWQECG